MSNKKKQGFTAFDLQAEVNDAQTPPPKPATAKVPKERVQRAIYFPQDVDNELRRWAFEDGTQVTKLVVQAVREFGERRKKQ